MEKGTVLEEASKVCDRLVATNNHYVVLRPTANFTKEQFEATPHLANIILAQNKAWIKQAQEKRTRLINKLPLFKSWKQFLIRKFPVTGYELDGIAHRANPQRSLDLCRSLPGTLSSHRHENKQLRYRASRSWYRAA